MYNSASKLGSSCDLNDTTSAQTYSLTNSDLYTTYGYTPGSTPSVDLLAGY